MAGNETEKQQKQQQQNRTKATAKTLHDYSRYEALPTLVITALFQAHNGIGNLKLKIVPNYYASASSHLIKLKFCTTPTLVLDAHLEMDTDSIGKLKKESRSRVHLSRSIDKYRASGNEDKLNKYKSSSQTSQRHDATLAVVSLNQRIGTVKQWPEIKMSDRK